MSFFHPRRLLSRLALRSPSWHRSAFAVNMLLIGAVVATALGTTVGAFYFFVQVPRAEMLSRVFAAQIASVSAAVEALPALERDAYLKKIHVLSEGAMTEDDPAQWLLQDSAQPLVKIFLTSLRQRLPRHRIEFTPGASPQLWAQLLTPDAPPRWLRIPVGQYATVPTMLWAAAALGFLALVFGGAAFLLGQLRRKLKGLGAVIEQVGRDERTTDKSFPLAASQHDDIAALKQRLDDMKQRLLQSDAERELMLAGVSHDLRSLLTRLRLSMDLDMSLDISAAPVRLIKEMNRIIEQFTDFSRPIDQEDTVTMDINDIVRELAAEFESEGATIDLDLMPIRPVPLRPLALRRMLTNLIENAIRHGGGEVGVKTLQQGAHMVLRVQDRGPGVSPEALASLVRPFFRTPQARAQCSGSGLGLAIASRVAGAHGGTLLPALPEGGGLRIDVVLPLPRR